jgi:hypothetical protein
MNSKEQKIKEEWIKILGAEQFEIDGTNIWPNGYFRRDLAFGTISDEELKSRGDFDEMKKYGFWHIRPKSLQGIEHNNHWIKIESEDDLPKEHGAYWTIAKFNEICANTFGTFGKNEFTFDNGFITYYQPIEKPTPPIY